MGRHSLTRGHRTCAMTGPAFGRGIGRHAHRLEPHDTEPEWPGTDVDLIPAGDTHLAVLLRVADGLRRL